MKELKAAGYKVLFDELEDHDSEVSWQGEGRTGQVALRERVRNGGQDLRAHHEPPGLNRADVRQPSGVM